MLKTDWKTKTDLFIKKGLYGILYIKPRKKNILPSRSAGDEKNLHPGGREFFLISLI